MNRHRSSQYVTFFLDEVQGGSRGLLTSRNIQSTSHLFVIRRGQIDFG